MQKTLLVAFMVVLAELLDCSSNLARGELLLSHSASTLTSEIEMGLLSEQLDVCWCLGLCETLGGLPASSLASGLPQGTTSVLDGLALCLPSAGNRLNQSSPSLASFVLNRDFAAVGLSSLLPSADPSDGPGLMVDGLFFPRLLTPPSSAGLSRLMNSLVSTEAESVTSGSLGARFASPSR